MNQTFLTFQCELRAETDPLTIETLERKGWVNTPQPTYDLSTQDCVWENCQWVIKPIIIPVPNQIAFWAFRVELKLLNKFNDVQNLIDNLPPQQNTVISTQWEYGNFLKRDDDLALLIINEGILTSKEMDGIFRRGQIQNI